MEKRDENIMNKRFEKCLSFFYFVLREFLSIIVKVIFIALQQLSYWYTEAMKQQPYWVTKPILLLKHLLFQNIFM